MVLSAPANGATRLHLPSPGDVPPVIDPAVLLGPKPGSFPNKVPGAISGTEVVYVGLGDDGSLRTLSVDQRIVLTGTGDFTLEIAGPATDVSSPDPTLHPGLRFGAIIWEGFSPGRKVLRAHVTLDPAARRFYPVPLTLSGGSARIENASAQPRQVLTGDVDRDELGALLDRMRAMLIRGEAPIVGRDGIPDSLAASGRLRQTLVDVTVPFVVDDVRNGSHFVVSGAHMLPALDKVRITAKPAPPDPQELRPPGGARTWRAALAGAPGAEVRKALVLAQVTLWQSLRIADYQAFLGTPLGGNFRTTYEFGNIAGDAPAAGRTPVARVRPARTALALVAAGLIAANGVALWRRA